MTVLSNRDFLSALLTGGGKLTVIRLAVYQSLKNPRGATLNYVLNCGFWKLHLQLCFLCAKLRRVLKKPRGEFLAVFGLAGEFFLFCIP